MIAVQFPESWKLVRAYAAEDGATETTPIMQNPEMSSYFPKERTLQVKIFEVIAEARVEIKKRTGRAELREQLGKSG